MSNNNISLYANGTPVTLSPTTEAPTSPTPTPTVNPVSTVIPSSTTKYPQHYSPLRLKVSVGNKLAYFAAYNLPNSLPINGYMDYIDKLNNNQQYTENIYPISTDVNLSQNASFTVSTIFDINSRDIKFSSKQPLNFYLDFSGFNKVSYKNNYTFSYYRSAYFIEENYNQSINPYEYLPNISASEIMMENINWANDDCTHRNYIGIGNLYKYLFNSNTLKDSNNDQTLKSNLANFLNDTGNTLSNNPTWANDVVAGESPCAPVSWTNQKSFTYFTKDKMYFNGFQYLWETSKIDRTDSILLDYYSKANNTAWISEIEFHNADFAGRFNKQKRFLIYDTMPQQFKIRNTVLLYITARWVDSNGSLVSASPFQFTSDRGSAIRKNIYFKFKLQHSAQNLPSGNYNKYTFETYNITISPNNNEYVLQTHGFHFDTSNTTYLDDKNLIQFKEYGVNLNTYLGTIINDTSCGQSALYLDLNRYSNTDRNDFSNYGNTLFPIKYKLNNESSTYYVSYVDYRIKSDIVNQYTHREIISYSGSVDIIKDKFNSINSPSIYNLGYIGSKKFQCSLRFVDGYDSVKQEYLIISSINPKVSINIAHASQKIHFKYNGNIYNVQEKNSFIKNKSTVYSDIKTDFTSGLIDDVFAETAVLPSKHIKYKYINGESSYLEYVAYADCEYGKTFYNTSISIDLDNITYYSKPGSAAGVYCWVDYLGKNAHVTIDSTNNKIVVNNINWYEADCCLQDIIINFEKVTLSPKQEDKYIEYHFGENTPNNINMSVNYNSAIISANNTTIGYLLTNGIVKSPVITLPINGNTISETVYINTGFYTDIYNSDNSITPGVYIYKHNNINGGSKLTYYNDYNCETASTLKFSGVTSSPTEQLLSDGGKAVIVTNDISNAETKNITYLSAYLLFNRDICMNILPNEYMDTALLGYYQSSYRNKSGNTILFIDNTNSNEINLPAGQIFDNDLTLYTKCFPQGTEINCLYYPLINNLNSTSNESVRTTSALTSNTIALNNIVINDYINTPKLQPHNLRKILFNTTTTQLKFNISANMLNTGEIDYGCINYRGTVQPINLDDENTSYVGNNYNNELIDNRFMLMNKSIPLYDITHETLKYIATQYQCDYCNKPYTAPVGIDVYFHPYYPIIGTISSSEYDCTHLHSKTYDSVFTKHYIYDIPVNLDYSNLKELPITNIQYVIKNDTTNNVTIDGINYKQGDYIYLKPSPENSLSVWDLVNASIGDHTGFDYNSFRDYILFEYYSKDKNNKILSVSINEIKIDGNSYSLSINDKWLNNETGNIEFNLSNIRDISDFTRKYNITSKYNLANINLSDIITVNDKKLIYIKPIYLGFDNSRFNIFNTTNTDDDKYNPLWKNLLSFIDTSTDYKLDSKQYKQMQITSFYISNFNHQNCQLIVNDDYTNTLGEDNNVIWDGNLNGTDELKNIYNLYADDNVKIKSLNNKINNSTNFQYKIILSNYTFILNCKLFTTANAPESSGIDIQVKFTLGNSAITTTAITLDKNNTINFDTFYITDEQLANIKFNQPGYLFFDPISDSKTDNYEVKITFWDENQVEIQTTPAGTIVIENGKQKKWNILEYINANIDKGKKVNYISIKYIKTNNGDNIEKYVLKPNF